jgi:hypothetical protein
MAQQRRNPQTAPRNGQVADPFGGDFSQERVATAAGSWPVLQWHGGLANLVGDADNVKINGGVRHEVAR